MKQIIYSIIIFAFFGDSDLIFYREVRTVFDIELMTKRKDRKKIIWRGNYYLSLKKELRTKDEKVLRSEVNESIVMLLRKKRNLYKKQAGKLTQAEEVLAGWTEESLKNVKKNSGKIANPLPKREYGSEGPVKQTKSWMKWRALFGRIFPCEVRKLILL